MGKIRSVRGDLMDHGFNAKTTIELKNGEQDNYKIVSMQWLLTILFALPLGFNKFKQVAAEVG